MTPTLSLIGIHSLNTTTLATLLGPSRTAATAKPSFEPRIHASAGTRINDPPRPAEADSVNAASAAIIPITSGPFALSRGGRVDEVYSTPAA